MAKLDDISINIGVTISEETVRRCCQLLSIYFQDNPNKGIELYRSVGSDGYKFADVCITEVKDDDSN